jgi:hypothetical protein
MWPSPWTTAGPSAMCRTVHTLSHGTAIVLYAAFAGNEKIAGADARPSLVFLPYSVPACQVAVAVHLLE